MSFEVLEKLEAKIQTAVDTIALLQMEVEELKEEKQQLQNEAQELREAREELEQRAQQVQQVQQEHAAWQERIRSLLGKMEDVE
ncbi:cell division protein ZapB [Vibrio cholerae]